jgi:hypothetical protein
MFIRDPTSCLDEGCGILGVSILPVAVLVFWGYH